MPRLQTILAIALGLCLPPAVVGAWHFLTKPAPDLGYALVLQRSGFYALNPPSQLFPPGSIGTVETLRNNSLVLHPTCNMNQARLITLLQVSGTVENDIAIKMSNALSAHAQAVADAISHSKSGRQTAVNVSMKNMQILSMSDENLRNVRNEYLKDTCEEVIAGNLRAGSRVCQTREVLQGDVSYDTASDDDFSAELTAKLAKELSGSADVALSTAEKGRIRGTGLYFGIKISLRCFQLDDLKKKVADAI